jgi:hypothetical protein
MPAKEETKLTVHRTNFNARDIKLWELFGIKLNTLKFYNVFPCKTVNMIKDGKSSTVRYYSKHNPVYAYQFGKDRYKIYCPLADKKENKWIGNHRKNDIEGFDQLKWVGEMVIVTKSLKDVMLLHELGYEAVSLHSETNILSEEIYNKLKKRYKEIVCFYDNDATGRNGAAGMLSKFGILNIEIPETAKTKKGNIIKDITDYYFFNGFEKTDELMNQLMRDLKETRRVF